MKSMGEGKKSNYTTPNLQSIGSDRSISYICEKLYSLCKILQFLLNLSLLNCLFVSKLVRATSVRAKSRLRDTITQT